MHRVCAHAHVQESFFFLNPRPPRRIVSSHLACAVRTLLRSARDHAPHKRNSSRSARAVKNTGREENDSLRKPLSKFKKLHAWELLHSHRMRLVVALSPCKYLQPQSPGARAAQLGMHLLLLRSLRSKKKRPRKESVAGLPSRVKNTSASVIQFPHTRFVVPSPDDAAS